MLTEFPILGVPVENVPMRARNEARFTVDEYLAMERAVLERHIYLDGEIFAMAGESDAHGIISVNVVALLVIQLKGKPCQARTHNAKVRSGPIPETGRSRKGLFSYPDVLVVCGEVEYHDAHTDVILNPKAIFEILSESTEAFDRGEKFKRLQKYNPTFTDYILISQDTPQIVHFRRQRKGNWPSDSYAGLDASVEIASIGCTLKLADVYDRVVFAEG